MMDITTKIIPAIMPDDYEELAANAGLVRNKVDWVQIDVMDGKYTDSVSWPYASSEHFDDLLKEDEGLPFWRDLNYELDLMVANPKEEAIRWVHTGIARIILHLKTLDSDAETLIDELKNFGLEIGIAILPNEDYSSIEKFIDKIDVVQFMGIEQVGFQHQEFATEILDQIKDFHNKYPEKIISVDGAVNLETARDLVKAGANRLVSGSFVFAGNVEENIKELEDSISND